MALSMIINPSLFLICTELIHALDNGFLFCSNVTMVSSIHNFGGGWADKILFRYSLFASENTCIPGHESIYSHQRGQGIL